MTTTQQFDELKRSIWKIANDVRGTVDGWDFKQYVLGALFYRFISENFSCYIEGGDDSIHYTELDDNVITDYNLSVSSYMEAKDTREVINITELNQEIKTTVSKIDGLRTDIDAIVAEIEGSQG